MSVQVLLIAAVGLLPGAPPPKDDAAKPPKVWPYYARVEIQGVLNTGAGALREPLTIEIPTRPRGTRFPLKVSELKDWTEKNLEKYNGRIVRVTGTLELLPVTTGSGVTEDRLTIVAKTLEFREEKDWPIRTAR
jgi:hypothetical protein